MLNPTTMRGLAELDKEMEGTGVFVGGRPYVSKRDLPPTQTATGLTQMEAAAVQQLERDRAASRAKSAQAASEAERARYNQDKTVSAITENRKPDLLPENETEAQRTARVEQEANRSLQLHDQSGRRIEQAPYVSLAEEAEVRSSIIAEDIKNEFRPKPKSTAGTRTAMSVKGNLDPVSQAELNYKDEGGQTTYQRIEGVLSSMDDPEVATTARDVEMTIDYLNKAISKNRHGDRKMLEAKRDRLLVMLETTDADINLATEVFLQKNPTPSIEEWTAFVDSQVTGMAADRKRRTLNGLIPESVEMEIEATVEREQKLLGLEEESDLRTEKELEEMLKKVPIENKQRREQLTQELQIRRDAKDATDFTFNKGMYAKYLADRYKGEPEFQKQLLEGWNDGGSREQIYREWQSTTDGAFVGGKPNEINDDSSVKQQSKRREAATRGVLASKQVEFNLDNPEHVTILVNEGRVPAWVGNVPTEEIDFGVAKNGDEIALAGNVTDPSFKIAQKAIDSLTEGEYTSWESAIIFAISDSLGDDSIFASPPSGDDVMAVYGRTILDKTKAEATDLGRKAQEEMEIEQAEERAQIDTQAKASLKEHLLKVQTETADLLIDRMFDTRKSDAPFTEEDARKEFMMTVTQLDEESFAKMSPETRAEVESVAGGYFDGLLGKRVKAEADVKAAREVIVDRNTANGLVTRFYTGVDEDGAQVVDEPITFDSTPEGIEELAAWEQASDSEKKDILVLRAERRKTRAKLTAKADKVENQLAEGYIPITTFAEVRKLSTGGKAAEEQEEVVVPKFEEDWDQAWDLMRKEFSGDREQLRRVRKAFDEAHDKWAQKMIDEVLEWENKYTQGDAQAALDFIMDATPDDIKKGGRLKRTGDLTETQQDAAKEAAKALTRRGAKQPRRVMKDMKKNEAVLKAQEALPELEDNRQIEGLAAEIARIEETTGQTMNVDQIRRLQRRLSEEGE